MTNRSNPAQGNSEQQTSQSQGDKKATQKQIPEKNQESSETVQGDPGTQQSQEAWESVNEPE
jgi:hypothetical protein